MFRTIPSVRGYSYTWGLIVGAALLALLVPGALPYPSGAPSSACTSMRPLHGVTAQTTASPYSVVVSETFYDPGGDALWVRIEGPTFKGFLLHGRRADWRLDQEDLIGTFSVSGDAQNICGGIHGDAVTHTSSTDRSSILVTWTPPPGAQGHVEFRATIVQSKEVFWEDVFSKRISDSTARESVNLIPPTTTPRSLEPNAALPDISSNGCGSDKGCLGVPKGCSGDDCTMMVTWTPPTNQALGNAHVHIDMMAKSRGWVALALSEDKVMGLDSVMECVVNDNWVEVGHSYNGEIKGVTDAVSQYQVGISAVNTSFIDGVIRCSFKRAITVGNNDEVYDLTKPYYLFLGIGEAARGVKFQHRDLPAVSTKRVVLASDTETISGAGLSSGLIKVHAIFMVTAWTILVCPAVLLAQYFKDAWPGKKSCDKKLIWFSMHRIIQLATVACTVIAFIVIFVEINGYSQGLSSIGQAHPILGIIVMVLALVNPIMGFLRPATNFRSRVIFIWAHRIVGCTAQFLAAINMYVGFMLPKSALIVPIWVRYMVIIVTLLYLGAQIALYVHQVCIRRRDRKTTSPIGLPKGQRPASASPYKKRGLRSKYTILGVYIGLSSIIYLVMFFYIALG